MKLPKLKLNKCKKAICRGAYKVGKTIRKNLPTILTWTGTGCAIASPILSGIATSKSIKALNTQPDDSSFFDDMKVVVPKYIPTAIATAATIACGHGSNHINLSRLTAMSATAAGAIGYLSDLKQEVKESVGEDGYSEIMSNVAKKRSEKLVLPWEPDEGEIILYEPITEQLIVTTPEQFIRAREHVNRMLNIVGECTLASFVDILGGRTDGTDPARRSKYLRWCLNNESQLRAIAEQNSGGIWVDIDYGIFQDDNAEHYRIDYNVLPEPLWEKDVQNLILLGGMNNG